MKAALGVQLAQALETSFGLDAEASEDYVDVLTDGFAIRLFLFSNRSASPAAAGCCMIIECQSNTGAAQRSLFGHRKNNYVSKFSICCRPGQIMSMVHYCTLSSIWLLPGTVQRCMPKPINMPGKCLNQKN